MTPEQQVAYLADSNKCPFCGTDEIEAQVGFEADWSPDDMQVWQIVFCMDDDCSRQWRDIYTLTGVEDADDQPPRVGVKQS
jgi:RNA polymerase subunit RPABC4/transcription elongation factor Spt4